MEPRGLVAYFMPPLIDDLRPAIVVFADTIFNVAHDPRASLIELV
jgi:hypothetical protein